MHEILVNRLFKLAQEKVWLGPLMTIAVDWDVKQQNKNKPFRHSRKIVDWVVNYPIKHTNKSLC